jgi:multidrug resistance efflux pump
MTNREVPRASLRRAKSAVTSFDSTISKLRTLRLQAQHNANRWQKLYQSGDVSKMDLEERLTQAKAADDDVKNAEAQRNTALEDVKNIEAQINTVGEDVKQAQAQLKVANDDVATLRTGLKVIEQDISVAEAALASADARKSEGVIVSQISGYVVSRELEPGAVVNPGTPILKIADPTTIWATVFIDESNSNSALDADGEFTGKSNTDSA